MGRIVVGIDGSEQSYEALRWGYAEAKLRGATVDAVCSFHLPAGWLGAGEGMGTTMMAPPTEDDLAGYAEQMLHQVVPEVCGDPPDVEVAMRAVPGPPARALEEASRDAELLVVGTRGHGDIGSVLLGSVATHCVHHAGCPVVVVRTPKTA